VIASSGVEAELEGIFDDVAELPVLVVLGADENGAKLIAIDFVGDGGVVFDGAADFIEETVGLVAAGDGVGCANGGGDETGAINGNAEKAPLPILGGLAGDDIFGELRFEEGSGHFAHVADASVVEGAAGFGDGAVHKGVELVAERRFDFVCMGGDGVGNVLEHCGVGGEIEFRFVAEGSGTKPWESSLALFILCFSEVVPFLAGLFLICFVGVGLGYFVRFVLAGGLAVGDGEEVGEGFEFRTINENRLVKPVEGLALD